MRMSKQIRKVVETANSFMQHGTLKENETLFYCISQILIDLKMYKGFNFYTWTKINGKNFLALAAKDKDHTNEKGQFVELQTDIRQFRI